jgi:hypothetical protein
MVLNPRQNGVTLQIDTYGENYTTNNKFISLYTFDSTPQMSSMVHQPCVSDQRFFK